MAEEDRLGVKGIANEPDTAVKVTSDAFRRNRQKDASFTTSTRRGVPTRGRGKQKQSPIGSAFGNLATLGIAKLLTSQRRSSRNQALGEQRFQQKEARAKEQLGLQERGVASLETARTADTAQGAERIGIARQREAGISSRAATAETRLSKQAELGAGLNIANIAIGAGVPLKDANLAGVNLGFDIPKKTTSKFSDQQKGALEFIRNERQSLRTVTGTLRKGSEERDRQLREKEISFLDLGDSFGPEAEDRERQSSAERDFLKNSRANRGVAGGAGR
jgi:hypothetical protein